MNDESVLALVLRFIHHFATTKYMYLKILRTSKSEISRNPERQRHTGLRT